MRIAITGGSGRIGRTVTALALAEGHEVVSIDIAAPAEGDARPGVTYLVTDTAVYEDVERSLDGCDALVHLAAIISPGRLPDHVVHNQNVAGSYNALRAAAGLGIRRMCQASSINAIGGAWSRWPRYDYLPVDEAHPTYNEDPYSLSKWICEQQGDSIARRFEGTAIASMRFHGIAASREQMGRTIASHPVADIGAKHLWGYTLLESAARACLRSLTADFVGHEAFFIVAPDTMRDEPTADLVRRYFPDVPIRTELRGNVGLYGCAKAERLLGWRHDDPR